MGAKGTCCYRGKKQNEYSQSGIEQLVHVNLHGPQLIVPEDIIERLKLSLSEYHGCDIIDVNPGVGTFSSTLHEHLKPRTHVLMEPDHELYLRWLQPMIDGDSKSYRFVPESGIIWDNLRKLDTDGILPSQTLLNPGHPDLSKPNKTLLFVANLGYHPAKAFGGFTSITSLMLHQLITAIRTHSIFQAYGQVRMLLWIPDRLKKQVLPRMVAHRKKACIETELHCHSVVEVAGSKNFVARTRRDHYIDLESAARTQERMRSVNIITPSSRQSQLEEESVDVLSGLEADQSIAKRRPYLDELAELEAALERGEFEQSELTRAKHTMVIRAVRKSLKAGNRHMADGVPEGMNPRWFRLLVLRYRYTNDMSEGDRFISMVQDFMTIQNGYHLRKGLSGKRADKARESLTEKLVAWKNDFNALKANAKNQLFMNLHDEILFRQTPSVLMWDRRPYEPLMVSKEEFFPQQEMALLDIMPKSVWPSLSGSNVSDYDYFECITSALYVVPSQSIVAGLKALAPGAADWIVPRCPSFTDIPRGGMIDLDFLSVRCLNQTMWQELFEAWMDWPFKPTKYEFMARLGTQDSKYSYATTMGEELDEMSFDEESV